MSHPNRQPGGFAVGAKVGSATWFNPITLDVASSTSDAQFIGAALSAYGTTTTASSVLGSGSWSQAAYDTLNGRWIAWIFGGSTTELVQSIDGGGTWSNSTPYATISGASALAAGSFAAGPANTYMALTTNLLSGSNTVFISATPTVTTGGGPIATNGLLSTLFYYPQAAEFVGVAGVQTGGSFGGFAIAGNSGAPTDVHTSLPATWQSGTNHVGAYYSAVGATDAIVAMAGATAGVDTPRLLHVTFPSSVLTFTDITPAVVNSKRIDGVAYDAVDGIWAMLVFDGTNSNVYTSPDLSTWTLQHTFAGQTFSLIAVGSVFATSSVVSYNGTTSVRVQVSGDGGATWHFGNLSSAFSTSGIGLFSGPAQAAALSSGSIAISRPGGLL